MDILEGINNMAKKLGGAFSPLENIIINSQYKILAFSGRADGTTLGRNFLLNSVVNKRMLIKSVKLIPYAFIQTDVLWNATSGDQFAVPGLAKIPTVIDTFTTSSRISLIINGTRQNIFASNIGGAYTLDLFVDNIYFNYKARIETIDFQVTGDIFTDLPAGTTGNPLIKVLIECYSY